MIVIPTYNRYDIKTLTFLEAEGFSPDEITLYVVKEEYDIYKAKYPNYTFKLGVLGIRAQREYIQSQYPLGTILICMDDDIEGCNMPLRPLFKECVDYLTNSNLGMVTFNPTSNLFYKRNFTFKEGRYLGIGFMHILKVDNFKGDIDFVEDYDRSLKYLKKYGANIRRGDAVFKTKFKSKGGLESQRTNLTLLTNQHKLLYQHPGQLYFNYKKDFPNIKIRRKEISQPIIQLPTINLYDTLHDMLKSKNLRLLNKSNNRLGFPNYRSAIFGITRSRFSSIRKLSYDSNRYPELYAELLRIGNMICPFPFTHIQINHNLVCPKHKDKRNVGDSLLVSLGDYTGGEIVIEGVKYSAYHTPIIFNGSMYEHWNEPIVGNKYSIIYFFL